jgi:murein DD-endopeptidase MepM/ murein hydrolase activator NlpD
MSKYQYPIDGNPGKDWVVRSPMGWRIHPVKKTRKHHNGTDITPKGKAPFIEAFADGKVLKAQVSTAPGGGFGHYVVLQHKIDGEWYTSLYAHLVAGSIQVKPGQKVKAGQVLGKMGTTGMSTGVHLHWEIWKGKTHGWSADGKGFVEPVGFVKALIAAQKAKDFANESTPENAPTLPAVNLAPKPSKKPSKPAAKPATKAPAKKPAAKKPAAKPKTHKVVSGETLGRIAAKYKTTVAVLTKLNKIKNANLIKVGQVIKLP